jgi:hypothetical protein
VNCRAKDWFKVLLQPLKLESIWRRIFETLKLGRQTCWFLKSDADLSRIPATVVAKQEERWLADGAYHYRTPVAWIMGI